MVAVDVFLNAFKSALREVNPSASVQKALSVHNGKLFVLNRTYELHQNVHLVAFGKAAPAMVQGAERVLGEHIRAGIASVPVGSIIPQGLDTKFYTGAEFNLPDEKALENTMLIEKFISEANSSSDQLILFLVSGGGSALLTAPNLGITLNDKVALLRLLQNNGAEIKRLNVVRTALSRLKGGGLAMLAHPSKMISLIISDIVGDPLELISSGPTIASEKPPIDPIAVLGQLGIQDKVPTEMVEALRSAHLLRVQAFNNRSPINALNQIIASNSMLLNALAEEIKNSLSLSPFIVTNRLEGNATDLGVRFAELIKRSIANNGKLEWSVVADLFLDDYDGRRPNFECKSQSTVLLFGGESTVSFDANKAALNAKGGRNQEMILSAFHQLSKCWKDLEKRKSCRFALFSLGSDGQDGPTDAAGAFLTDEDLEGLSDFTSLKLEDLLESKCSYQFWSEYQNGKNLVKIGKTGVNVMDVQMLVLEVDAEED